MISYISDRESFSYKFIITIIYIFHGSQLVIATKYEKHCGANYRH